uniref:Uncharacterized protein n=1 Tax=Oryza brachyantha TaxID=4533 RepID=J3MNF5_ORYBR
MHLVSWSISVKLKTVFGGGSWYLTSVYGSQVDDGKLLFLNELVQARGLCSGGWMVASDFNMFLTDEDKNNGRINRRITSVFRSVLNQLKLKDISIWKELHVQNPNFGELIQMQLDSGQRSATRLAKPNNLSTMLIDDRKLSAYVHGVLLLYRGLEEYSGLDRTPVSVTPSGRP